MTAYWVIFAAGFAGSFHCIGMCGGFACVLGRDPQGAGATLLRHLLYNAGRLTTYCFLGGLAGALGQVICTSQGVTVPLLSGPLDGGQRILAMVSGLLMIAMALQFFGLLNRFQSVCDLADDLQFRPFLKRRTNEFPKRLRIFDHKNPA